MAYATGRCMCHPAIRRPFEVEDVVALVRKVYGNQVAFHDGDGELAPGLSAQDRRSLGGADVRAGLDAAGLGGAGVGLQPLL